MSDIGLQSIKAQEAESTPRPVLQPSPGLGAWLHETGGSLVFSTYQSARIFFLSGQENGETVALERIVGSAMGLAAGKDQLWIANKEQIWRFANVGSRKIDGQGQEHDFDAVYMPRWGLFVGPCDTHDILTRVRFQGQLHELLFVNTNFSCIASISGHYNFVPVWKPPFVSGIGSGDRCHLNGMGARDGQLAFATACAETDTDLGWKAHKKDGGILMEVPSGDIIARGFAMPHSPRWHDGKVWMLDSGRGDFGYVDPANGRFEPVALCPGFARGLHIVGDYAVIGLSRLRPNTFAAGLPIKERLETLNIPERCGLLVVDLRTGQSAHWLTIEGAVSELYDVAFLPGVRRPFTPGFSHPELHRQVVNLPSLEGFPLQNPEAVASTSGQHEHRHDGDAAASARQ